MYVPGCASRPEQIIDGVVVALGILENKTKEIVKLGESNEKNIIVEKGLKVGDVIYLNAPLNSENFRVVGADLIPLIKTHK